MPPSSSYRIVSPMGGRWIPVSPANEPVGDRDYATPDLAAAAIVDLARDDGKGAKVIRDLQGKAIGVEVEDAPRRVGGHAVNLVLSVSPEMQLFLDRLAEDRGEDREEVVRMALGLLRIAQDAKAEGNGLAIVTPDLDIEQEVTGF